MLQAIEFIKLEQNEQSDISQRKIRITMEMDACKDKLNSPIVKKGITEFGRMKA
jgi:hypothetical protein